MKFPARFIAGNLIWTREGTVWAVWRVTPTTYPYLSAAQKLAHHAATRRALLGLPSESMLLSLCCPVDPYQVAEAIAGDIDLATHPEWRATVEGDLGLLASFAPFRRLHFVAAELPNEGSKSKMRAAFASARAGMGEIAGGAAPPVAAREVGERMRQASHLLAQLERSLDIAKATPGEIRWMYARALRRGVNEPFLDETWEPTMRVLGEGAEARLSGPSLVNLGDGVFAEGGDAEDRHRPRHRRYLRVQTESGVSFQAFLALSDMPHHFAFPDGSEWFARTDDVDFPVDWCARVRSVANRDAQLKARRQARQLAGQVEEYEGETSGPPESLAAAQSAIQDLRAHLSANPADPELQCSVIFSCWAPDLSTLEERVALLRSTYVSNAYDMHRPTGGQTALFSAMLPGVPLRPPVRDYVAYLLAEGLAAGAPFAGSQVGSASGGGMLLGFSRDAGTLRPVPFDPTEGSAGEGSGSVGIFGLPGFGKSYLVKRMAHAVLSWGGAVCALDTTEQAEYVRFAEVAPGRSQVVRVAEGANVCLDPLRIFTGVERVNHTLGFLTLLTGIAPQEVDGLVLEEAVVAVSRQPEPRMSKLLAELEARAAEDPDHAGLVHRKLVSFARTPLGPLVFGDAEPLRLAGADYVCFHVAGLDPPPQEHLVNEHLYRRLLPRQILSQALLFLLAAVARTVAFNAERFGVVLLDEVWRLTPSPQGRALIAESIRDGRKHHAGVWVISQVAGSKDLGDSTVGNLLAHRFVFRHARGATEEALRFLGMEPTPSTTRRLTELEPGACLYRDVLDRIGMVQALAASDPALNAAFDTNPTRRRQEVPDDAELEAGLAGALEASLDEPAADGLVEVGR